MKRNTPPFITPFAILSMIVLIGTSNLVVNHVTHTQEGAPARPTRVVNNQNRQPNDSSVNQRPDTDQQKPRNNSANSGSQDNSAGSAPERNSQSRSPSANSSRSGRADNNQSNAARSEEKTGQSGNQGSANSVQKK